MDKALRHSVLSRLDQLDEAAAEGETNILLPVARSELYRLAEGFRALLDDHQPDDDGRCRVCPGTLRTRRWPCSVWTTAHRHLIGDHADQSSRPHRSRFAELRRSLATESRREPDVEVLPTAIVTSGDGGPSEWDTEEFTLPDLPRATTDEATAAPPVGGHLETDHTRIYRAAVVDRPVRWPGPRI